MRQIFLASTNLRIKEVAQPLLDDYTVLVQVLYSYISSNTEVSAVTQIAPEVLNNIPQKIRKVLEAVRPTFRNGLPTPLPDTLKAELCSLMCSCSGHVIAVGKKITKIRPGDFVACSGNGYPHHGDLLLLPSHAVTLLTQKDHLKMGSIVSIGASALHSIRRAQIQLGETVCVYGLGLLGHIIIQLAKLAGCTVVGIDSLEERVAQGRLLGADLVSCLPDDVFEEELLTLTKGQGVDTLILSVTTHDPLVMQNAIKMTRRRGKIILLANPALTFNRDPFFSKELDLIAACSRPAWQSNYSRDYADIDYPHQYVRWSQTRNMQSFVELATSGKIDLNYALSYEISPEDLEPAYKKVKSKQHLGAVLRYSDTEAQLLPEMGGARILSQHSTVASTDAARLYIPASTQKLRVGIIYDGQHAVDSIESMINGVKNVSIVEKYTLQQILLGRRTSSKGAIDAFIFANKQLVPLDLIMCTLQDNVAVFVDGPLCVHSTDYERLKDIMYLPNIRLCTNFYRSLLPSVAHIASALHKRAGPLMLHYRVNESVQDIAYYRLPDYPGAVLTRMPPLCDIFLLLVAQNPIAVSVEAIRSNRDDIFPTDNFSVQISFCDGSVCSLLYTTRGNNELPAEKMEIFYEGKAIVLDELHAVYGYGFSSAFTSSYSDIDQRDASPLVLFLKNIVMEEQYTPPIPYERLLLAIYMSLIVDELICQGGGNKQIVV
jgi:polar amino acid transport system substrate-binding protein